MDATGTLQTRDLLLQAQVENFLTKVAQFGLRLRLCQFTYLFCLHFVDRLTAALQTAS